MMKISGSEAEQERRVKREMPSPYVSRGPTKRPADSPLWCVPLRWRITFSFSFLSTPLSSFTSFKQRHTLTPLAAATAVRRTASMCVCAVSVQTVPLPNTSRAASPSSALTATAAQHLKKKIKFQSHGTKKYKHQRADTHTEALFTLPLQVHVQAANNDNNKGAAGCTGVCERALTKARFRHTISFSYSSPPTLSPSLSDASATDFQPARSEKRRREGTKREGKKTHA